MSDRIRIGLGVAVFIGVAGLPFWLGARTMSAAAPPELAQPLDTTACIEDVATMRAHHMDLLNGWRNDVVRDDATTYTSASGVEYRKSLTGTCLTCHTDQATFCTTCHDYANVRPTCFDCHTNAREAQRDG